MSEFDSEQPEQGHQDPAGPNQVDQSVNTSDQEPDPSGDDSSEDDSPEAPVPAEPEPVEVAPADQSDAPGLLEQFEVTPERGYRKKS